MVQIRCGAVSITGNFRENNEDAFVVHPEGRYFIVADGMGGQSAGEKASELATELVPKKLDSSVDFANDPPEEVIRKIDEAVDFANVEIMALSEIEPRYHNMGTTITFLVVAGGRFFVGGVGDSRVYRLRGDKFEQLTTDHSLTQALLDAKTISPEEAATHRYRNVLYKYLGTREGSSGTDTKVIDPQPGDRYILCSDGVTAGVDDDLLGTLLAEFDDPQEAAEAIVAAAEEGGSKDNITCIVLHVAEE
ncbi:MAG: serine/threonine-protein phosphatase [Planctomycetota bacterium]|nr:MAG: serine/threonine-protein phosphatase [Planctomycetota bacterium]